MTQKRNIQPYQNQRKKKKKSKKASHEDTN